MVKLVLFVQSIEGVNLTDFKNTEQDNPIISTHAKNAFLNK